jgi:hypothetical protein
VIFIGELMKQAERYLAEGVHPRVLCDGFDVAQKESAAFLEDFKARRRPAAPPAPAPPPRRAQPRRLRFQPPWRDGTCAPPPLVLSGHAASLTPY